MLTSFTTNTAFLIVVVSNTIAPISIIATAYGKVVLTVTVSTASISMLKTLYCLAALAA